MKHEITAELFDLLNREPATKRDVTYTLVQIRKVLEHDGKLDHGLTFFCDWAVHPKLDRAKAKGILSLLDERLGHYNPAEPESMDSDGKALEVFSFLLLRRYLMDFLTAYRLPTLWAEDQFIWNKVLMLYSEQVCHTPLIMTRQDYEFKYLQKLVIKSLEPSQAIVEANPDAKHFGFTWEFTLDDGSSFSIPFTSNLPDSPSGWKLLGAVDKEPARNR